MGDTVSKILIITEHSNNDKGMSLYFCTLILQNVDPSILSKYKFCDYEIPHSSC
jgi:hypothetical protein